MTNIRYVGVMAKGLAIAPGFKMAVKKGGVYDVPDKIAKQFLSTKNWESISSSKKKAKKTKEKIEAPIEVPEETNFIIDKIEEDE